MNMHKITTRKPWDNNDLLEVCKTYLSFLRSQAAGEAYTKAPAVRACAERCQRSKGSIEAKMMNISAILQDHGRDWVTGYKPLSNYQKSMVETVLQVIK